MKKLILICMILIPSMLAAQDFEWWPGGTYDSSIPTPESVLGFEIGDYLTDHLQMIDYIQELAASTDRVQIFKYGRSFERRDMYLVIVSSPENMARLEEIRSTISTLKDPRKVSQQEADAIAANNPAIGWMNYAIDGNESAAFEAAIQVAYQLAAGTDSFTQKLLKEVVTIINPSHTADSHQRYVTWMKGVKVGKNGTADPWASEHNGDWLMATNNGHFGIDPNRDGFALSQHETRLVVSEMHHWNPQLWIDNHGETVEYFFAPFVAPINKNFPASTLDWAVKVGRNNAKHFDKFGWTFYKDETFDLYYPGYFDSYPGLNGAVSATYEVDGGGRKAFVMERSDNTVVTLRDAVHHHFVADMASLETLADNRISIIKNYYDFRSSGMEEVDTEQFKSYVLMPGKDEGRLNEILGTLKQHHIEFYKTNTAITSRRAQTYFDRTTRRMEFPAGSYIIPLKQPQKRLIKTLFEPDPSLGELFESRIAETVARNAKLGTATPKEGLGFYDVTAWAFPLTNGLEAAFTEEEINVTGLSNAIENSQFNTVEKPTYAYLFTNESDAGAKMAARLLDENYNVSLALKEFTNPQGSFPKGTMFTRVERNPSSLHGRITELAEEYNVKLYSTNSAWGETGISLGSNFVKNLVKPKVMMLTHAPTEPRGFGSVWFFLEERFDIPFTAVRTEYFNKVDLYRYNVIIFPDGSDSEYERMIGKSGVAELKEWIENGGTFIGLAGGARFAAREGVELADVKMITKVHDNNNSPDEQNEESEYRPVDHVPGSIFKATVNNDFYLGFGYDDEIAVQIRGAYFMSPSVKGTNVITFPANSHIQGHLWDGYEEKLQDKSYLADIPTGRGHVVLFPYDPTFRLYWQGLNRLLLNAILYTPAMKMTGSRH